MNLVQQLRKIRDCFDGGCEISVGEDGIGITGYDYHPSAISEDGHILIVREYYADFDYDEEKQEYKDTIAPLLEKIAIETQQLA